MNSLSLKSFAVMGENIRIIGISDKEIPWEISTYSVHPSLQCNIEGFRNRGRIGRHLLFDEFLVGVNHVTVLGKILEEFADPFFQEICDAKIVCRIHCLFLRMVLLLSKDVLK